MICETISHCCRHDFLYIFLTLVIIYAFINIIRRQTCVVSKFVAGTNFWWEKRLTYLNWITKCIIYCMKCQFLCKDKQEKLRSGINGRERV